jgi:hypothetical protein
MRVDLLLVSLLAQSLKKHVPHIQLYCGSIIPKEVSDRFRCRALTHTIIISAFEEYDGLRGIISAGSSFNCTFMKSS